MTAYFDVVVPITPSTVAFGHEYHKMNSFNNHFDTFPTPSSGSGSGVPYPHGSTPTPGPASFGATLTPLPQTSMNGNLSSVSPSYGLSYASDSSNASSPDLQNAPARGHNWGQPGVPPGTWYPVPAPPPTLDGRAPVPSTSAVTHWPVHLEAENMHSFTQRQTSPLLHPHVARHHPYLPELSMTAHRHPPGAVPRPLGALPLQHHHLSPHTAPTVLAPANALGVTGEERPKSGRLGVKRRQKYTRTRTGCLGCRARRIKCDEGRPICRRCTVAKRECVFPDPNEAKRSKKGWTQSDSDDDPETSAVPSTSTSDVPSIKIDTSVSSASQSLSAPSFISPHHTPYVPPSTAMSDPGSVTEMPFDISQPLPDGFGLNSETQVLNMGLTQTSNIPINNNNSNSSNSSSSITNSSSNNIPHNTTTNNLGLDLAVAGVELGAATALDTLFRGRRGKQPDGDPHLLLSPNSLLPWFPTAHEQGLVLHFAPMRLLS